MFVGSRRGMEGAWCPTPASRVTLLPGRGIARRLTLDNVGAVAGLLAAMVKAVALLGRTPPGRGHHGRRLCQRGRRPGRRGVAHPARRCRTERRAGPGQPAGGPVRGRLCRLRSRARRCRRAVVTGNPVRPEILAVDRSAPAGPRRAPPWACPPIAGGGGRRRVARGPAHQPGRPRAWPGLGGPIRAWPSATWWASGTSRPSASRPPRSGARGASSTSRCPSRTAWTCSYSPPMSPCSGPAPAPWPS